MKLSAFCLTVLLAGMVAGCSSGDMSDANERPDRQFQASSVAPLESRIAVAGTIDLQKVQNDLDKLIPDPLVTFHGERDDCITKKIVVKIRIGCKWNGEVKKKGPVAVSGADQRLDFSLPLHAWASVQTRTFNISEKLETDFTVTGQMSPALNSDWSPALNLDMNLRWDRRPTLRLFGVIPVTISGLVEPKIEGQLVRIKEQFEAEVGSQNTRAKAVQIWQKVHEPIKLSGDPEVWLRIGPKAVNFSGIHVRNNVLYAGISLRAEVETVLGERPKAFPLSPLPEIGDHVEEAGMFVLRLPITLEYDFLKKEVQKILKINQKWAPIQGKPDHYLTVNDVEIYPSGENLVLGIDFIADLPDDWLDTRGRVYFLGKPVVDNEQRILRIENLDFTKTLDNSLAHLASLFFKSRLKRELTSAATYRFGDTYDDFIAAANRELNRDFGDGVTSRGTLNYAKVDHVLLLETGVYLSTLSEGTLQITFGM